MSLARFVLYIPQRPDAMHRSGTNSGPLQPTWLPWNRRLSHSICMVVSYACHTEEDRDRFHPCKMVCVGPSCCSMCHLVPVRVCIAISGSSTLLLARHLISLPAVPSQ